MEKKLRIINLDVSMEDMESGVTFVALVDRPATESNFLAFSKNVNHEFKVVNEEKRIISGVLMLADTPIYRNDKHGEYMVQFSKDSVANMVRKFFRDGNTSNVNKEHNLSRIADGVYMIESFIIDTERMTAPKGFESVTNGSWFGSYKVDNDEVWNEVKEGKFRGFSIEGNFIEAQFSASKEDGLLEQIIAILKS